jgi:hypothetical protein
MSPSVDDDVDCRFRVEPPFIFIRLNTDGDLDVLRDSTEALLSEEYDSARCLPVFWRSSNRLLRLDSEEFVLLLLGDNFLERLLCIFGVTGVDGTDIGRAGGDLGEKSLPSRWLLRVLGVVAGDLFAVTSFVPLFFFWTAIFDGEDSSFSQCQDEDVTRVFEGCFRGDEKESLSLLLERPTILRPGDIRSGY